MERPITLATHVESSCTTKRARFTRSSSRRRRIAFRGGDVSSASEWREKNNYRSSGDSYTSVIPPVAFYNAAAALRLHAYYFIRLVLTFEILSYALIVFIIIILLVHSRILHVFLTRYRQNVYVTGRKDCCCFTPNCRSMSAEQ